MRNTEARQILNNMFGITPNAYMNTDPAMFYNIDQIMRIADKTFTIKRQRRGCGKAYFKGFMEGRRYGR